MIDPSNCVRYIISKGSEPTAQKLISWLSDSYPEISLIHQESLVDRRQFTTQLTFVHRYWGPAMKVEIVPIESTQTLILIPSPPDPEDEDVSRYEDRIVEHLPASSVSIRLARMDGNDVRALALIRTALREQRHHCWMQIQSELIRSLKLKIYEGDPIELIRNIPNINRDIDQGDIVPSQDENLVLDLWAKGYTAKQIALRIGRTEKTILNRVALMRKTYGEQLVPRRRMA
ncbi:MAG: hypothetical protein R6V73_03985 [Anaerolineales bacterium]|jgi:hypothetical protein